ncbi:MAG: RDD family protein [Breznakia sp.]
MADTITNKKASMWEFLKKRSQTYMEFGRYLASDMTWKTLWVRMLAQLGDIVIMLFPMILWLIVFLLVTTDLVSISMLGIVQFICLLMLLCTMILGNLMFTVLFKGQSFGKLAMGLKVVALDNKEVDASKIIIREIVGRSLPLIVLYVLLDGYGIIAYYIINSVIVLTDVKYHRSMIDFILHTKIVLLDSQFAKQREEKEEPIAQEEVIEISGNAYDLHLYSSFSHDGEDVVEDIFKKAIKAGLTTISISDHNCVKANINAKQLSKLYKITYIDGINIDCQYEGLPLRLLGYFIDSSDPRFTSIEHESLAKEKAVSARRIELFEKFSGIHVDVDSLMRFSRFQVVSPETIARQVLTNVKYEKEPLLQPYLHGTKKDKPIQSFIADFFAKGKPAYVPIAYPELEDMISLIKSTGGICVLAHPMASLRNRVELMDGIIKLGLHGLEVFSPKHTKADQTYLLALAKRYHLGVSAGSEYHGKERPEYKIGKTTCPIDAEPLIKKFLENYA